MPVDTCVTSDSRMGAEKPHFQVLKCPVSCPWLLTEDSESPVVVPDMVGGSVLGEAQQLTGIPSSLGIWRWREDGSGALMAGFEPTSSQTTK